MTINKLKSFVKQLQGIATKSKDISFAQGKVEAKAVEIIQDNITGIGIPNNINLTGSKKAVEKLSKEENVAILKEELFKEIVKPVKEVG